MKTRNEKKTLKHTKTQVIPDTIFKEIWLSKYWICDFEMNFNKKKKKKEDGVIR